MKVNELNGVNIGYVGENEVESVEFDFSEWVEEVGEGGTISLLVKRSMDAYSYPVILNVDGYVATWTITSIDTAQNGRGVAQLTYLLNPKKKKSAVFGFTVYNSIEDSSIPPDPYENWLDQLTDIAAETQENAESASRSASSASGYAEEASGSADSARGYADNASGYADDARGYAEQIMGMSATANTLAEGSSATASYQNGVLTLGIPRGNTGATGSTGATPNLSIGTVTTGEPGTQALVTISGTPESPVINMTIPKGEKGEQGDDYVLTTQDKHDIAQEVSEMYVVEVSGSTPSITGEANTRYICGEISTLSITPPASGTVDVVFESGSTPTVLTIPNTVMLPAWFDDTSLDANTTYEIMITDATYGVVMLWTA